MNLLNLLPKTKPRPAQLRAGIGQLAVQPGRNLAADGQAEANVSKGNYIFGHLFGAIGILVGDSRKWFCLPLFIHLQDGIQTILGWKKAEGEGETPSNVVQMIEQGFEAAKGFGQALLLLDRYFLSVPALERFPSPV